MDKKEALFFIWLSRGCAYNLYKRQSRIYGPQTLFGFQCTSHNTGIVYQMCTKETTFKKTRIQKFKGKFKEIKGGGTILFTKTIQSITNPDLLAVYVYLASKPPEWNANVNELSLHFKKMGRDKIRKCLSDLCMIGLLKRVTARDERGIILGYDYYLYLHPAPEN